MSILSGSLDRYQNENDDSVIDVGIQQENFNRYTRSAKPRPSIQALDTGRKMGNEDELDV